MKSKTEKLQMSQEDNQEEIDEAFVYADEVVKIYMSDGLKVMALQGLDLRIKRGEMVAIIGKSGSGKSTLLNMIGGLETPTAGKLIINGKDLSTYTEKEMVAYRRSTVGFVWQKSSRNLLGYLTVVENIVNTMYTNESKKEKKKRALELLRIVEMEQHADKFPHQLSGGEAQRVAIALAVASGPKLLLADEPTGAVDTKTASIILRLFKKLNEEMGITVVIVTHDMHLANLVDRVIMIADGKVSTEKIRYSGNESFWGDDSNLEDSEAPESVNYSILDKAHRVQLTEDVLSEAGIESNRVKISVENGRVIIEKE